MQDEHFPPAEGWYKAKTTFEDEKGNRSKPTVLLFLSKDHEKAFFTHLREVHQVIPRVEAIE